MHIIVQIALLACALVGLGCACLISVTLIEANAGIRKLLAFLDGVHLDHRKEHHDGTKDRLATQQASSVFHKTMSDLLKGCRDSIDAIRSVVDEHSPHRRDTVGAPFKMPALGPAPANAPREPIPDGTQRGQPASRQRRAVAASESAIFASEGDRDSAELMTRVMAVPTAAEIAAAAPHHPAIEPPGSAPILPSEPAQRAAGLSRPKSPRSIPHPLPARSEPPPRSQTIAGMASPLGGPPETMHRLPIVVPPPMTKPRFPATLVSMEAASATLSPASPARAEPIIETKRVCGKCTDGVLRLPTGALVKCTFCEGTGLVPTTPEAMNGA
jgi:hypothetical protein